MLTSDGLVSSPERSRVLACRAASVCARTVRLTVAVPFEGVPPPPRGIGDVSRRGWQTKKKKRKENPLSRKKGGRDACRARSAEAR